jgi:hypothetical protein
VSESLHPPPPAPVRRPSLGRLAALLALACVGTAAASATDLATARLLIAGTRLTVTPEAQTVPFDTPTLVETHLAGYDAGNGTLPADLLVRADRSEGCG